MDVLPRWLWTKILFLYMKIIGWKIKTLRVWTNQLNFHESTQSIKSARLKNFGYHNDLQCPNAPSFHDCNLTLFLKIFYLDHHATSPHEKIFVVNILQRSCFITKFRLYVRSSVQLLKTATLLFFNGKIARKPISITIK